MRTVYIALLCLSLSSAAAQEVIELPFETTTEIPWQDAENEYFSDIWNTEVVTNVSAPTMQVFQPEKDIANGTSVIIAPVGDDEPVCLIRAASPASCRFMPKSTILTITCACPCGCIAPPISPKLIRGLPSFMTKAGIIV